MAESIPFVVVLASPMDEFYVRPLPVVLHWPLVTLFFKVPRS
jgi:hypothetical protein